MREAARSVEVFIVNTLDKNLKLIGSGLDHGIWTDDMDPRQVIRAGEQGLCGSESKGFMTGTEGWVKYNIADYVDFTFRWNIPYAGDNSSSADVPAGYRADKNGGSGSNAEIKWHVRKT